MLEIEQRRKETNWKRLGCVQPISNSGQVHRTVRCARLVSGENAALGIRRRRTTIIHRTVRWCTGLSDESSTTNSSPSGKAKGRRGYNSPDCPVSQRSPALTVGRAIFARRVGAPMVGRGHRTVRCALDSVRCANYRESATVGCARKGRRSRTGQLQGLSGAPPDRRQDLPSKNASNGS